MSHSPYMAGCGSLSEPICPRSAGSAMSRVNCAHSAYASAGACCKSGGVFPRVAAQPYYSLCGFSALNPHNTKGGGRAGSSISGRSTSTSSGGGHGPLGATPSRLEDNTARSAIIPGGGNPTAAYDNTDGCIIVNRKSSNSNSSSSPSSLSSAGSPCEWEMSLLSSTCGRSMSWDSQSEVVSDARVNVSREGARRRHCYTHCIDAEDLNLRDAE